MKYIKKFESRSNSFTDERNKYADFIKNMEYDIEGIFIEMLDVGYDLEFRIVNHPNSVSDIRLSNERRTSNSKDIKYFIEMFHTFYDYIKIKGFDLWHISLHKWICDENNRAINFGNKSWEFIENKLLEDAGDRILWNIIINIVKK